MKTFKIMAALLLVCALAACGKRVEVPPAHVGKIMTKDGYQGGVVASSKFRLPACWAWCDKLVLLNTSDQAVEEKMAIFIPKDKLVVNIGLRVTLSVDPSKTENLFRTLSPSGVENDDRLAVIKWETIYNTYAQQIVLTETREYASAFSIGQIASSMEKMNADLRVRLTKQIESKTPFKVRYVGITNIKYPDIITKAQENAAERREQIQSEQARLEVSQVTLARQLQEAQLQRQIETEKALTEANRQRVIAESVDPRVLELRRLEIQEQWIAKWQGHVPSTVVASDENGLLMQLPGK